MNVECPRCAYAWQELQDECEENNRLRAALEGSPCPYPVIEDKTVAACIKAGKCGCDNREALSSVSEQVPKAEP